MPTISSILHYLITPQIWQPLGLLPPPLALATYFILAVMWFLDAPPFGPPPRCAQAFLSPEGRRPPSGYYYLPRSNITEHTHINIKIVK